MFSRLSVSTLLLLSCFCAQSVTASGETRVLSFSVIESGFDSGIDTRTAQVLRTEADWKNFWTRHKSNQLPVPKPPSINFQKDMVVAVTAGPKPTTGYSLKILSMEKVKDDIVIGVQLTKPAPGGMAGQMITQPYEIVRCPATAGTLKVDWKGDK